METLDRTGAVLSAACAVHCLSLPMLGALFTSTEVWWLSDPLLEYGILTGTVLVAILSLGVAWRRHRKRRCAVLFLMGLATLLATHNRPGSEFTEAAGVTAGAAMLFGAHLTNSWFCGRCRDCSAIQATKNGAGLPTHDA